MRVDPEQISQLLHPQLDPNAEKTLLARGLNASPGAATGVPVIDPDAAAERAKDGTNVILVRKKRAQRIFKACMPPVASLLLPVE